MGFVNSINKSCSGGSGSTFSLCKLQLICIVQALPCRLRNMAYSLTHVNVAWNYFILTSVCHLTGSIMRMRKLYHRKHT
jgi:hypothetical protein